MLGRRRLARHRPPTEEHRRRAAEGPDVTSTHRLPPLLGFVALAACLDPSHPSASLPAVSRINPAVTAASAASALGREDVGRDAFVLADVLFHGPVRIVRPGDVGTTDFISSHFRFELDDRAAVGRVTCG